MWLTVQEYVEKDTGEVLTREEVKTKYTILKKSKHVQKISIINYQTGQHIQKGIITYTYECRRSSIQGQLF